MCLAVPGRVEDVTVQEGLAFAKVDFGGVRKDVCVETLPGTAKGDWILVHAGVALQRLDEAASRRMLSLLGGAEA